MKKIFNNDNQMIILKQEEKMMLQELKKELKKAQKNYPFVASVLKDMEENPENYQKYLKMKFPIREILSDNC